MFRYLASCGVEHDYSFSRPAETGIVDETQTETEKTGIADIRYGKQDAELRQCYGYQILTTVESRTRTEIGFGSDTSPGKEKIIICRPELVSQM